MKVDRRKLLFKLKLCARGLSSRGVEDQSDLFIFSGGKITTFNGEVRVQVADECKLECAVPASELLMLVEKFTGAEVDLVLKGSELRLKSLRASAGITCQQVEVAETGIPKVGKGKMFVPPEKWLENIISASQVCGTDETMVSTMCVHITSKLVEACDNFRAIRIMGDTGFAEEFFIPAANIQVLHKIQIDHLAVAGGWLFVRMPSGMITIRGQQFSEYPNLDELLEVTGEIINFPKELQEGIQRARITTESHKGAGFGNSQHITRVTVSIEAESATITSRSGRGWYKEDLKLQYEGPKISFDAHPDSLLQILNHSFSVQYLPGKLIARSGSMTMVISTTVAAE